MTDAALIETELNAYVDNQLDLAARIRVERALAQNPEAAARVMADIAIRNNLRLAMDELPGAERIETRQAARKLSLGLSEKRIWNSLQRIAAIGILITTGWVANATFGPFAASTAVASVHPPAFVDQAIQAHQTTLLRAQMPSQPVTTTLDADEIRQATAIVLPKPPADWTVSDVQIFPSDFGPSVEVSIRTARNEKLSLFAVRPGFFAVEAVKDVTADSAEAAYWQIGEVAYVLVSSEPNSRLVKTAEQLTSTLY